MSLLIVTIYNKYLFIYLFISKINGFKISFYQVNIQFLLSSTTFYCIFCI